MRSPLKICKRLLNSLKRFGSDFVHLEEGQMAPMMMTALLIAYTTFMGAAIDMGNLLWHKNHATTAANAACLAGAADLAWVANQGTAIALANYESGSTGFRMAVNTTGNAPPPASSISGDCGSASSSIAMCAYAEANGYNPNVSGNDISWTVSNVLPPQQTINPNGLGSVSSLYHSTECRAGGDFQRRAALYARGCDGEGAHLSAIDYAVVWVARYSHWTLQLRN